MSHDWEGMQRAMLSRIVGIRASWRRNGPLSVRGGGEEVAMVWVRIGGRGEGTHFLRALAGAYRNTAFWRVVDVVVGEISAGAAWSCRSLSFCAKMRGLGVIPFWK